MKGATIGLLVLGAIALLVAKMAAPPIAGHAAPAIDNGSVSGQYAYSLSTHDPLTGQEGASVGAMVFDGAGAVTGEYSQSDRCSNACGQQLVSHAPFAGTYAVRPDGSAALDICITLDQSTNVRVIFEAAFSNDFRHLRLVMMEIASPCVGGSLGQVPNVTSGTADKL